MCAYGTASNNTACDDGYAFTINDACDVAGTCRGVPNLCTSNPCPTPTTCVANVTCVPLTGACIFVNKTDSSSCDDGDITTVETCQTGVCVSRPKCQGVVCAPQPACRRASCNSQTGTCDVVFEQDMTSCTDVNGKASICANGVCAVVVDPCAAVNCTIPPDTCHLAGTCSVGKCFYSVKGDGQSCDDGLATTFDACVAGKCKGTPKCTGVVCKRLGQCYGAATCQASSGVCIAAPLALGTACDDNDNTTHNDTCTLGVCLGIPYCQGVVCSPIPLTCRVLSTCVPTAGECVAPLVADGAACDDLNPWTVDDACTAGVCAGVVDMCDGVKCSPRDCHGEGVCNPATGVCEFTLTPGATCAEGAGMCNAAGVCNACGESCAPSSSCSFGHCSSSRVCVSLAVSAGTSCDDGLASTRNDECSSVGACTGVSRCGDVTCLDPPPCQTSLGCNATSGLCDLAPAFEGEVCDDQDLTTLDTRCNRGRCIGRTDPCLSVVCADPSSCQLPGVCRNGTCRYAKRPDLAACDDLNNGTIADECLNGVCIGSDPCVGVTCPASMPCETTPVCMLGACPLPTSKAEGAPCASTGTTVDGRCQLGLCVLNPPDPCLGVNCSAKSVCFKDGVCVEGTCANPMQADGTTCDTVNTCVRGVCQVPDPCASKNCDAVTSCRGAGMCSAGMCFLGPPRNEGVTCDDNDATTFNDTCADGRCVGSDPCARVLCATATSCRSAGSCARGACVPGVDAAPNTPCIVGGRIGFCTAGTCDIPDPCANANCPAPDQCHFAGKCVTENVVARCVAGEAKPDGAYCDDDDDRTVRDVCTRGRCRGSFIVACRRHAEL